MPDRVPSFDAACTCRKSALCSPAGSAGPERMVVSVSIMKKSVASLTFTFVSVIAKSIPAHPEQKKEKEKSTTTTTTTK